MSTILGLQPIKEWAGEDEKRGKFRNGTLSIYCGSLLIGFAEPVRDKSEMYHFHSMLSDVSLSTGHFRTLEDIKINIECALKEYIKKFVKIIQSDTQVRVMTASPNRKLNHPGKKDGNGKR